MKKSKEEIIEDLRRTREEVWRENILLILDSNEYIFGLTKVISSSEQLSKIIPEIDDLTLVQKL
jgi:hypothetical protein